MCVSRQSQRVPCASGHHMRGKYLLKVLLKQVLLIELTDPWEERMEEANKQKKVQVPERRGWKALGDVGCRGFASRLSRGVQKGKPHKPGSDRSGLDCLRKGRAVLKDPKPLRNITEDASQRSRGCISKPVPL